MQQLRVPGDVDRWIRLKRVVAEGLRFRLQADRALAVSWDFRASGMILDHIRPGMDHLRQGANPIHSL